MKLVFSNDFDKKLKHLGKKQSGFVHKIRRRLRIFEANPKDPVLANHKLKGELNNVWSITVERNFRLIYILTSSDEAYFIGLGTHDEVYRK